MRLMRKLITFILAACTIFSVGAQPNIIGRWKSDAERTMNFNSAHAKLSEKKHHFLSQILGHLTVTFTENEVHLEMPSLEVTAANGKRNIFVGFKETNPYQVLGYSSKSIAILSPQPVTGGPKVITVYNFENSNIMWIYLAGADKDFPDEHLREYFVRIP